MIDGVRLFLQNIGMLRYYDIFCAKGFDLESDIPHISLKDLEQSLMIESSEDRSVIHVQAKKFKPSPEHTLFEWLHKHSLDHYFINFIQSELTDLKALAEIQLPNEDLYDELEIVLPGHQKRLERAVASLQQERNKVSLPEIPVTQGWWGKPACLPQAKFDFLCVTANLFASHEPENKASIDFMVDSGSDVSTVQEKTLEGLNLDLIGPIYSCGIHGGDYTNLYRAKLEVGGEQLDIEVIASNYDSLGSRIVRHFRHVIDGSKHIWLKSNYKDPLPAILPLKLPARPALDSHPSNYKPIESSTSSTNTLLPASSSMKSSASSEQNIKISNGKEIGSSPSSDTVKTKKQELCDNNTDHKAVCTSSSLNQNSLSPHRTNYSSEKSPVISNGFSPIHTESANKNSQFIVNFQNVSQYSQDKDDVEANHNDCHNETLIQTNEDIEHNNIDKISSVTKQFQSPLKLNVDLYTSGHKRHRPLPLNDISSPQKVQKLVSDDNVLPVLKDTDDDIDNMNPVIIDNGNVARKVLHQDTFRYLPNSAQINLNNSSTSMFDNNYASSDSKAMETEVVHILDRDDEEGEPTLLNHEGRGNSLEFLRQDSNFLQGHGISVVIPMDDLENGDNDYSCQTNN